MGERIDEIHDEAFGDECREEVRVILALEDDQVFATFWNKLRHECLKVRRGIEASPNGFRLAPFDKSLTQRRTWLQRQVVNPIETLQAALSDENALHFAHWERYGDDDLPSDTALLDALAKLKNKAISLQREFEDEITGETGGKITHTHEIRHYVVFICLSELRENYPNLKQSRGNWDKELGQSVGPVPDFVRRVFFETTGNHEQLDGPIQANI
ncbi:hypothetical protein [Aliiroseovarius crassostreae]|uniref:hypothetical protein n=1 Tax=Aliiroseovarius crassostreae TaxID=154981 RepID=UPI0022084E90|nr:hypothetical protein [Aliiroseovarius crassostreae]UWP97673.1 hypothetical protein K3X53_09770 [Aliiroseovarius crassostreae]